MACKFSTRLAYGISFGFVSFKGGYAVIPEANSTLDEKRAMCRSAFAYRLMNPSSVCCGGAAVDIPQSTVVETDDYTASRGVVTPFRSGGDPIGVMMCDLRDAITELM